MASSWEDRAVVVAVTWVTIGGLGSLSSLLDVELDGLAFLQRLQPAGLQRADVHEQCRCRGRVE